VFLADGYDHWVVPNNQKFWAIEPSPVGACELPNDPDFEGHTSCFVSTYRKCSKAQTVMFKNYGFTETIMMLLQPEIIISEW